MTLEVSGDEERGSGAAGAGVGAEVRPSCSRPTGFSIFLSVCKAVPLLLVCVKLLRGLAA